MVTNFWTGKRVLFQGDSITDCGRVRETDDLGPGYPAKVAQIYRCLYPGNGTEFINRGVSGNRSCDLLARYEEDFLSVKPDFISILIGINDTWRRYDSADPTSTQQYENNYRTLLEQLRRDLPQAKLLVIEPFLIPADPQKETWHEDLAPKIQAARRLARQYADYFLPMDGLFQSQIVKGARPEELSEDGVHPTEAGHAVIAEAYLKLLGLL
ncbi:MAG TPA: SGNH/GDSL hydrolase family protein [Candidatus Eisenbergiella merdipullorum]|uniref:SGNH/GDSL hydrolase family protein n=1 Tax=Candidatus Eisenbergiella merdipullorum TaxID=2838553 RepID=A0A9D2I600_9FIRM|nr:SGNH/GDSL hydrolase family protein [Candidatus Eisenbergiella merdipullorum]